MKNYGVITAVSTVLGVPLKVEKTARSSAKERVKRTVGKEKEL